MTWNPNPLRDRRCAVATVLISLLSSTFGYTADALTCRDVWLMGLGDIPTNAIEICRREAAQGDVDAQANVGAAYSYGMLGVSRNLTESFKWLKMAAEGGSTDVFSKLYTAYHTGQGTQKDLIEALKYQVLAIEHGSKRYSNESSYFGMDPMSQPSGRAGLLWDIQILKTTLEEISEDAAVAFTRADRWDEAHKFKKFRCLSGDTLCSPEKID